MKGKMFVLLLILILDLSVTLVAGFEAIEIVAIAAVNLAGVAALAAWRWKNGTREHERSTVLIPVPPLLSLKPVLITLGMVSTTFYAKLSVIENTT